MSDRPGDYKTSQPFEYVVGGSLPLDAVSYVVRSADAEFYAGLKAGKFCYVLNSRQMGKSSLRVRTMARLQADGIVCVSIDMTAIGSAEVTAEQWYLGVLWAIVKQVREQTTGLADWKLPTLRSWWVEREGLSFVQRWGEFIEVLLGEVGERVVIFVDEIDSVLGLGFRADDFFAAIRECYNRRVDEPQYDRLTFALLGVCAPQDLIQDKRRTPFNIGQAIELSGFTEEEAITLAKGLPGGEEMLREVLGWTGGQPFLTQRVCRLVREEMPSNPQFWGDMSVDEIVQSRIIRVSESNDEQVHFQTIGDRMMADESLAGAMLGMYQRVLTDGGVGIDGSAEQIALRLTGAVVKRSDRILVMNRIYEGVFGIEWVRGKLAALRPYGEELRSWQESTDKAWLLRGDSLENAKAWANEKNRKLAPEDYQFLTASQDLERSKQDLERAKQDSDKRKQDSDKRKFSRELGLFKFLFILLIAMWMSREWANYQLSSIRERITIVNNNYIRGFIGGGLQSGMSIDQELRSMVLENFLNRTAVESAQNSLETVLSTMVDYEFQEIGIFMNNRYGAISLDRKNIISGGRNNWAKIQIKNGKIISTLNGHSADITNLVFSSDNKIIASGSKDNTIKLWTRDGKLIQTLYGHDADVNSVVFSPDSQMIASGSSDKTIRLWSVDGRLINTLQGHDDSVLSVSFSPDGKNIISGSEDNNIKLWTRNGRLITTLKGHQGSVHSVAFSPDGKVFASGGGDNNIKLWTRDGLLIKTFFIVNKIRVGDKEGIQVSTSHDSAVNSVIFSPDSQTIISGSSDKTIKSWRRTGKLIKSFIGHNSAVNNIMFSVDGQTLVSASDDDTVKLWRTIRQSEKSDSLNVVDSFNKLSNESTWKNGDSFILGCYWLQDHPDYRNFKEKCDNQHMRLPDVLINQAIASAKTGNYSAAETYLKAAKGYNSKLSIDKHLARARETASDSLLRKADRQVTCKTNSESLLGEADGRVIPCDQWFLSADPQAIEKNFDFLTQAYLEEANFLVRRAKSINPELNVEQELKRVRDSWKTSVDELRMKK